MNCYGVNIMIGYIDNGRQSKNPTWMDSQQTCLICLFRDAYSKI